MSTINEFQTTLAQLDNIHLSKLSVEKLREMQKAVHKQIEQLAERAKKFQQTALAALERSDPDVLSHAKNEAAKLRAQKQNLVDLDTKLETTIQGRIIRENMARKIGSTRRLACLEAFILTLIVFVLGLLVYDNVVAPEYIRPSWLSSENIFWIDLVCCTIFMSEFFFRLSCAESKKYVWKHHWIDFVTSIPIPGEAQLARFGRAARLARFARLLRLLRFLRFFFMIWRGMDKLQDVIDVKMMKKTIRWAVFVTLLGAIAMYKLEGTVEVGPDGVESPNPVGTAVLATWWSFTTVLTGGFGDIHNPVSITGQILTGVLVITGMVVISVFTATLTSLFVGEQSEEIGKLQDELNQKIDQIGERLDRLDLH
jgi:voltage-gated potassium channel